MKELRELEKIELDEYGVNVKRYLTLAEIQTIVNAVMQYDKWALREECMNYMILLFATDISKEELDGLDSSRIDLLVTSGLMSAVKPCIENLYKVYEGLKYHESLPLALKSVSDKLPEIIKEAQKNTAERK